jgi:hypothetical protein
MGFAKTQNAVIEACRRRQRAARAPASEEDRQSSFRLPAEGSVRGRGTEREFILFLAKMFFSGLPA